MKQQNNEGRKISLAERIFDEKLRKKTFPFISDKKLLWLRRSVNNEIARRKTCDKGD